ncbi:MAG TPA: nicotinate-nucleotide adenylyltransferase [Streptosporangiaceae bacterium]|nr:nicotinate-nucleotide adenylyltransferase [Streptosporangiaceae bacterium]
MTGAARIGVMGGTFDPVHNGHLMAANEAGHALGLDEVIFVPAGQPWQKNGRKLAPAEDRYQMVVIATAANPLFSVSRLEIDRPGDTYTVDTLRELRTARGPGTELFFIIGADALSGLSTWHEPAELLTMVHFIGLTRGRHQLAEGSMGAAQFSLLEVPALEISSTLCRERVQAGLPLRYLVPDDVISYISKRGLYRG